MSLSRAVLDALLPPGSLWTPEDGSDFDLLLDGMADNAEAVREMLAALADLRSPERTAWLADLEREYGITPEPLVAEATRRARLLAAKTDGSSDGSLDFMQDMLQTAGFDVSVYGNNPAVNPATLLEFGSSSIMNNADAMFGKAGVMFAGSRGYLLVNGPVYYAQALVDYDIPAGSEHWPLVFFIGGAVTRDGTGAITQMEQADVPGSRRAEFVRQIVKYKPLHAWCGLIVRYV